MQTAMQMMLQMQAAQTKALAFLQGQREPEVRILSPRGRDEAPSALVPMRDASSPGTSPPLSRSSSQLAIEFRPPATPVEAAPFGAPPNPSAPLGAQPLEHQPAQWGSGRAHGIADRGAAADDVASSVDAVEATMKKAMDAAKEKRKMKKKKAKEVAAASAAPAADTDDQPIRKKTKKKKKKVAAVAAASAAPAADTDDAPPTPPTKGPMKTEKIDEPTGKKPKRKKLDIEEPEIKKPKGKKEIDEPKIDKRKAKVIMITKRPSLPKDGSPCRWLSGRIYDAGHKFRAYAFPGDKHEYSFSYVKSSRKAAFAKAMDAIENDPRVKDLMP